MNTDTESSATNRPAKTRSSLACLLCRSRHLKCDATRPSCNRCTEAGRQCQWAQSRRGGLDRAALAERRKRLATADGNRGAGDSSGQASSWLSWTARTPIEQDHVINGDTSFQYDANAETVGSSLSSASPLEVGSDVLEDSLITSYYQNFHRFHPLVLPRRHLAKFHQDPNRKKGLKPLIATIRFIGHIYKSREWSLPFKSYVETCLSETTPTNPFLVQCRLLYSVALFWHGHKTDAAKEMDAAIQLATELRMFQKEFAAEHGASDPVLTECWRRTWWMVYMIDAFYAGTLGTMNFRTIDIEATVELPCEEENYESGPLIRTLMKYIPEPKTLQDFECRDLAPETITFSSFAYLIGAVQCAALAISTTPKITSKDDSPQILHAADSIMSSWLLLLPKGNKQVMSENGEIDDLMFQAHLLVHVATIGLHRPLSDLKFNPVEDASSCARAPPLDTPSPDLVNVHTIRVLKSVEAQIRLLALPTQEFQHSPFTTCMVSEGTLALLSACQFLLKGQKYAIARDQIRLTIGCLKVLGQIWPRTAKNVEEIQLIARHVLGSKARSQSSRDIPDSSKVPSLTSDQAPEWMESDTGTSNSDIDIFPSLGSMEDICGWYNLNDIDQELSWWGNGQL